MIIFLGCIPSLPHDNHLSHVPETHHNHPVDYNYCIVVLVLGPVEEEEAAVAEPVRSTHP
jgi:hypothetical protein